MVINYTILQHIKKNSDKKESLESISLFVKKKKENRIDRVFAGHNRMSRGCRLEPVHTCTYLTLRQAVTFFKNSVYVNIENKSTRPKKDN